MFDDNNDNSNNDNSNNDNINNDNDSNGRYDNGVGMDDATSPANKRVWDRIFFIWANLTSFRLMVNKNS